MRQYLIDTHVFLWFVSNAKELSKTARTLIEDGQNEFSSASPVFGKSQSKPRSENLQLREIMNR